MSEQLATVKRIVKRHIDVQEIKRLSKTIRNVLNGSAGNHLELVFNGWEVNYPDIKFIFDVSGKEYFCTLNIVSIPENEFTQLNGPLKQFILSCIGLSFAPHFFVLGNFTAIRSIVPLSREQIDFFEKVMILDLGEYRYREGLDPTKPIRIVSDIDKSQHPMVREESFKEKVLILNGGGKDTIDVVEMCKTLEVELALFSVNLGNSQALIDSQDKISHISGIRNHYHMDFRYDKNIYQDRKYSLNGLPNLISFNFMSYLPAIVHGFSYVVSGNEFSSNFGNVKIKGMELNHQYPKTFEFERLLDELSKAHLSDRFRNFSLLRPFHDIQLAKFFSKHEDYYGAVASCNIDPVNWCKKCPKCAFTYIALLAFIEKEKVLQIFGSDFLEYPDIRREVVRLTTSKIKPWECVGTKEECKLVLSIVLEKYPTMEFDSWPTRSHLEKCCSDIDLHSAKKEYLEAYNTEHLLPPWMEDAIQARYLHERGS